MADKPSATGTGWSAWLARAMTMDEETWDRHANPRAFPPPATTDSWSACCTFGKRVWLNRNTIPIPQHHARIANILSVVSGLGVPVCIYGLITAEPWRVMASGTIIYAGKLWFVDRMAWLYQNMKDAHPDYASWQR